MNKKEWTVYMSIYEIHSAIKDFQATTAGLKIFEYYSIAFSHILSQTWKNAVAWISDCLNWYHIGKYEYYSIVQVLFVEVGFPFRSVSFRADLGFSEGSVGAHLRAHLGVQGSVWGFVGMFIVGVEGFVVGYLGQSLFGILLRGSMGWFLQDGEKT